MIESIHLKNFKCFSSVDLKLGSMTLLSGLNGAGKSSVMQALLLIRQSFASGALQQGFLASAGDLVDLGTSQDVLFEGAQEDVISIGFATKQVPAKRILFEFSVSSDSDRAEVRDATTIRESIASMLEWGSCSVLMLGDVAGIPPPRPMGGFHYLSAERMGPRKFLPIARGRTNDFDLGVQGEFVLHALQTHKDTVVLRDTDPRVLNGPSARLGDQVEAWLGEVSPGVRLDLNSFPEADLMVGRYSFGSDGELRSKDYRATNVGFGLSYVLPVLVALLGAPEGGLVLIENPEAHMHPRGQTRLGELCARAAAAGVQVVIETHSDHFMDGARIAVRQGVLDHDELAFHYFGRSDGGAVVTTPDVDSQGKLSFWPEGFFDQHRRNAAQLLRPPAS